MPSSLLALAPRIIHLAWERSEELGRPIHILDIGPGNGKYGLLCREYLGARVATVDAIEKEPRYVARFKWLDAIYDHVGTEDAAALPAPFFDQYDLVLLLDVLEHLTESEAADLLPKIGAPVIVSTPRDFFGNNDGDLINYPTEHHRSVWSAERVAAIRPIDREDHEAFDIYAAVLVRCAPLR